MRRPYIHLAGDRSGWPVGTVPTPTTLRNFDQYSSELVNGEDGGTWAPKDPIVLGPFGATTWTLGTAGSRLGGDVETVRGNRLCNELLSPGLICQSGTSPVFENARSRSILVSTAIFTESNVNIAGTPGGSGVQTWLSGERHFELDTATQSCLYAIQGSNGTANPIASVVVPIRAQHRGSTITSVDFRYKVSGNQSSFFPWLRASGAIFPHRFRALLVGNNQVLRLHTNGSDFYTQPYDPQGWAVDMATSWADYYAGGNTKVVSYVCNQNNVAIDTSARAILLQFQPNTLAPSPGPFSFGGDIWLNAVVNLTSIGDLRPE